MSALTASAVDASSLPLSMQLLDRAATFCSLLPPSMAAARHLAEVELERGRENVDAALPLHRIAVFGCKGAGKSTLVNCVGARGLRVLPDQPGDTSRSMVLSEFGVHNRAENEYAITMQLLSREEWFAVKDRLVINIAEDVLDDDELDEADGTDDAEDNTKTPASQLFERWLQSPRAESDVLKAVFLDLNHVSNYGLSSLSRASLLEKVQLMERWHCRALERQALREKLARALQSKLPMKVEEGASASASSSSDAMTDVQQAMDPESSASAQQFAVQLKALCEDKEEHHPCLEQWLRYSEEQQGSVFLSCHGDAHQNVHALERLSIDHMSAAQLAEISKGSYQHTNMCKVFPQIEKLFPPLTSAAPDRCGHMVDPWPLLSLITVEASSASAAIGSRLPYNVRLMDSRGLGVLTGSTKLLFNRLTPPAAEAWIAMPPSFRENNVDVKIVDRMLRTSFKEFGINKTRVVVTMQDKESTDTLPTLNDCINRELVTAAKGGFPLPSTPVPISKVCAGLYRLRTHPTFVAACGEQEKQQYEVIEKTCEIRKVTTDGIDALLQTVYDAHATREELAMSHATRAIQSALRLIADMCNVAMNVTSWSAHDNIAALECHSQLQGTLANARSVASQQVATLCHQFQSELSVFNTSISDSIRNESLNELQLHHPRPQTLLAWTKRRNGIFSSRSMASLQGEGSELSLAGAMLHCGYILVDMQKQWKDMFTKVIAQLKLSRDSITISMQGACSADSASSGQRAALFCKSVQSRLQLLMSALDERQTQFESYIGDFRDRGTHDALEEGIQEDIDGNRDGVSTGWMTLSKKSYCKPVVKSRCIAINNFFTTGAYGSMFQEKLKHLITCRASELMIEVDMFMESVEKEWKQLLEVALKSTAVERAALLSLTVATTWINAIGAFLQFVEDRNAKGMNDINAQIRSLVPVSEPSTSVDISLANAAPRGQASAAADAAAVPISIGLSAIDRHGVNGRRSNRASQLINGGKDILLFRGLCPVISSVLQRKAATSVGPWSALMVSQSDLMRPEWHHVSGFVLNEYALTVGYVPDQYSHTSHVAQPAVLDSIAARVRTAMTGSLLQRGVVRAHWVVSGSAKQQFDSLQYLLQQRYSGSDLGYMGDWADFANACLRARGASLLAQDSTSRNTQRMRIWLWAQQFQLPHHPYASLLHGNPNVSTSKSISHAVRYAVGRKAYVQGNTTGAVEPLLYGLVDRGVQTEFQHWHNPDANMEAAYRMPACQLRSLLGVVLLLVMPKSELDQEYVLDVEKECERGRLQVNDRIFTEAEVSFYGFVPATYVHRRIELPLLHFDFDSVLGAFQQERALSQAVHTQEQLDAANPYRSVYGVSEQVAQCPMLGRIRVAIAALVRSRFLQKCLGTIALCEHTLREEIGECVQRAIARRVDHEFQLQLNMMNIKV